MSYDSEVDTRRHIATVQLLIGQCIRTLMIRAEIHDQSKLDAIEKVVFDSVTPRLRELTYGSEDYKAVLEDMGEALKHHYANNSHHPEHYEDGVEGMDLIDVVEMLCDWRAATDRHEDGSIKKSLEINQERFDLSPQLYRILCNTVERMGW